VLIYHIKPRMSAPRLLYALNCNKRLMQFTLLAYRKYHCMGGPKCIAVGRPKCVAAMLAAINNFLLAGLGGVQAMVGCAGGVASSDYGLHCDSLMYHLEGWLHLWKTQMISMPRDTLTTSSINIYLDQFLLKSKFIRE